MNMQEYLKVRNYTYLEYCDYLQSKYGIGKDDYMKISRNNKLYINQKCKRGIEGLFAHHKYENKEILLCELFIAKLCPFEWQAKENIVYCDYLEHLLLHILVYEEECIKKIKQKPWLEGEKKLGITGALCFIIPELNNCFLGFQPTQQWKEKCYEIVREDKTVFFELLRRFSMQKDVCVPMFLRSSAGTINENYYEEIINVCDWKNKILVYKELIKKKHSIICNYCFPKLFKKLNNKSLFDFAIIGCFDCVEYLIDCHEKNDEDLNVYKYKKEFAIKNGIQYIEIPYSENLNRESILEQLKGKNIIEDITITNPELLTDWDYENNYIDPTEITTRYNQLIYWKCSKGHEWTSEIRYRLFDMDCPYCIGSRLISGENDIATTNPELLSEWDYEKNIIKPSEITLLQANKLPAKKKEIWWICPQGHSYKSIISKKLNNKAECPSCKEHQKYIEIELILANEWDSDKNGYNLSPEILNSMKSFWWICPQGHSWKGTAYSRINNGLGCPYCNGREVLKGFNDLKTTHPLLVKEWDQEQNSLKPTKVTASSNEKVWWKADCGHKWQMKISSRTNGKGCPYCLKSQASSKS